jgi:four helix bundle protein
LHENARFGRTIMSYRDLEVWQRSVDLAVATFVIARELPFRERRDIAEQMRSSSVSISSNIAESTGRTGLADQLQFAVRARASLAELDTQLEICRRLGWLTAEADEDLRQKIWTVGRLLSGLIRYYARRRRDAPKGPVRRNQSGKPEEAD